MLSCSIRFSALSFWMGGGGLESRCVGRVYGADGAVRVARHHPHAEKWCLRVCIGCREIHTNYNHSRNAIGDNDVI